jgi:hypothetical protein
MIPLKRRQRWVGASVPVRTVPATVSTCGLTSKIYDIVTNVTKPARIYPTPTPTPAKQQCDNVYWWRDPLAHKEYLGFDSGATLAYLEESFNFPSYT